MPSPIYEILIAVAGGVVFAILSWIGTSLWPIFIQKFYRDEPSIRGKWKTSFIEGETEYNENVTLTQKGRKVNGEITLNEGDGDTTIYKFEGRFKYLILTCTFESTDPQNYEQGSFSLRYIQGNFEGHYIYFSKESDVLLSSNYKWLRN